MKGDARLWCEVLELLPVDIGFWYAEGLQDLSRALYHGGRATDIVLFIGRDELWSECIGDVTRALMMWCVVSEIRLAREICSILEIWKPCSYIEDL